MDLVSTQAWFQKKLPHKPSATKAYYVNDRNESEVTKEGCKAVRQLMISLRYIAIALIVVAFIFPIYWMILTSIKPAHEVITYPPIFFFIASDFRWLRGGNRSPRSPCFQE